MDGRPAVTIPAARQERPGPALGSGRLRGLLPVVAVTVLVTAAYLVFSLRQWARFDVPSWDLGIFTQVLRSYSELRAPISDIKGPGFMILGDHFHPLLAILAPVYRLFPSGATVLVLQAVLIGLSVLVVGRCAQRLLGPLAGACIAVAYGLSWGLQSAVAAQFHEVALAVPLLAASCAALVRRDHRGATLWALPLLGVKETFGLTVAAVGVVLLIRGSRRLGTLLLVTGVGAFVLITEVVLPALNPDGEWAYASDSIIATLLSDPGSAAPMFTTGAAQKLGLLLAVLAITGFLALRSPIMLVALPTVAWRLTSEVPQHWGLDWHYSAVLMPVVFLALVDGLRRAPLRRFARWITAGCAVAAVLISAQFPLAELTEPHTYQPAADDDAAHAALAAVPSGATVATDITLMAYLVPTHTVLWVGSPDTPVPDFVVVDQDSGVYPGEPPQSAVAYGEKKFPGTQFIEVLNRDGFLVARRHT